MSERNYAVLNKNKLTDLADSIRQKTNTEDKLTVAAMIEAIADLDFNDNDNDITTINVKIEQSPHQTITVDVNRLFDNKSINPVAGGSIKFLGFNTTATIKPEPGYIAGKIIEEKVGNTIKFSATPAKQYQDDILYINDYFEEVRA